MKKVLTQSFASLHLYFVLLCMTLLSCAEDLPQKNNSLTMRIGISGEVTNFYLKESLQHNAWNFNLLFAQTLFLRTESNSGLYPDLAESYSTNTSPHTIKVKLKKNLKFHNNTNVTCEDVLWSYKDAHHSGSPYLSTFQRINTMACDNNQDFILTTRDESLGLIKRLLTSIRIYPKESFPKNNKAPIGSGPYKFKSANSDSSTWARFDEYNGPLKPHSKSLMFFSIPDSRTRYEWLNSKKLDVVLDWPLEMNPVLHKNTNLQFLTHTNNTLMVIGLNLQSPCFKDIENRAFLKTLFLKNATLITNLSPSKTLPIDSKLLDDSKILKSEKCEKIEIFHSSGSSFPYIAGGLFNNSEFKKFVAFKSQETSVFYENLSLLKHAAFVLNIPAEKDPVVLFEYLHSSQVPPQKNRFMFMNAKADQILTNITNNDSNGKNLEELQKIVDQEIPFISLGLSQSKIVFRKNIKIQNSIADHPWLMVAEAVKQ